MYSKIQIAVKYLKYKLVAKSGKGHGVHSPFVYNFIRHVLADNKKYPEFENIERRRNELLKLNDIIDIEDFGAGSSVLPFNKRVVSDIAATSLKNKKYSQLLFRLIKYFKPENVIELGTSFGITTTYMAKASKGTVFTFEGSAAIIKIARETFNITGVFNVDITEGNFAKTLCAKVDSIGKTGLVFFDGNHRKVPTLEYFELFKNYSNDFSIFIFDDIHWSKEMEEAWDTIKGDESVTSTIDLFFIGIVFFRKEFKEKQHFTIRF